MFQKAMLNAPNNAERIFCMLGALMLSDITPARLSSYKAKRFSDGVSSATVVKELQFVRRVFSLCKKEWQLVKQSPFEFFTMPKIKNIRVKFLNPGQFENLLSACPEWLRPIVIIARHTGMRRGNILSLKWEEVDLQGRIINLERTKNGYRLSLPLTERALSILLSAKQGKVRHLNCQYVFSQEGKPYSPYQVSMAFKRACNRSGLGDFRFHDLRHDFASSLVQRGNDLYLVQSLLGHRDGRMTQRYAHLRVEDLQKAVETLEWGHKKGHSENEKGAAIVATP